MDQRCGVNSPLFGFAAERLKSIFLKLHCEGLLLAGWHKLYICHRLKFICEPLDGAGIDARLINYY